MITSVTALGCADSSEQPASSATNGANTAGDAGAATIGNVGAGGRAGTTVTDSPPIGTAGETSNAGAFAGPASAGRNSDTRRDTGTADASVAADPDNDAGMSGSVGEGTDPSPGIRFAPFETNGQPLPGSAGAWTYIEFADTSCRDGSPAGVYVNLGSSKKLMIFLEGGGRCVDEQTCVVNTANIAAGNPIRFFAAGGVLDRSNRENPVREWNWVQVPYCTGDRHGGANAEANVPGVGLQKLVGYLNMKKFLNRIVPTFSDATDVLLAGISAGGFGAAQTSVLVQRAFPNVKVKLIIDSGAFLSKAIFAECDQARMRTLSKAEETYLADCGPYCPRNNDYSVDYGVFLAQAFADRPAGLISATGDLTMRAFFSTGNDNCTGTLDLFNPSISAAAFREDLLAYREKIKAFPNFGTFHPEGEQHTFLAFDEFYTIDAGGVRLVDWFTKILNGESPGHAGP